MINEIEDAIISRLQDQMAAAAGVLDVQKGFDGIFQPAVYVSTEAGQFDKVSQGSYRQSLTIFVDMLFSHLGSERERRKGVYLIMEAALQALLLQQLGLAITPIVPKNWRNTTTSELRDKGLIGFSLELSTSFLITATSDEELVDLLRIGLEYYLQDPDDDVVDATDLVELGE